MNRFIVGLLALCVLLVSGCDYGSASEEADKTMITQQQEIYQKGQPLRLYPFSQEREAALQIYDARNTTVQTWTVWRSDYGKVLGDCASVGYPIPYDTSLTNPEQSYKTSTGTTTIEQAEPNGLFSSKNSTATWVRCVMQINGATLVAPLYIEDKVSVYPWPVVVNYETDRVLPVAGALPTVIIRVEGQ